jgi:membrane-associated protease RseP (regulator of RpoE activity)
MNLVLALVLHATVFSVGVRVPAYELQPPIVKQIDPNGPGAAAGVQPGDRIVVIDGTETPRWRDAQFLFAMNARQKLDVEIERGGQRIHTPITPRAATKYDIGEVGLYPGAPREPRIVTVVSNDPADRGTEERRHRGLDRRQAKIKGAPKTSSPSSSRRFPPRRPALSRSSTSERASSRRP